jgi:hypothetical protein
VRGERATRRLAAILATDVAGYSRLIGADEEGTLSRLKALRAEVIDPKIAEHHGRSVKTSGDGLLVEFASVVGALRCAAEIQAAAAETMRRCRQTSASNCVSASMSATSWSRTATYLVTASTSPPGSKAWSSLAVFAFRRGYARTLRASSSSPSAIWASSSSRTSSGLCAPTQSAQRCRLCDMARRWIVTSWLAAAAIILVVAGIGTTAWWTWPPPQCTRNDSPSTSNCRPTSRQRGKSRTPAVDCRPAVREPQQ